MEDNSDIADRLSRVLSPQQVLQLRPTKRLQSRIEELLEQNRTIGLSDSEKREWQQIECTEHIVRLAKAHAAIRLHELNHIPPPDRDGEVRRD